MKNISYACKFFYSPVFYKWNEFFHEGRLSNEGYKFSKLQVYSATKTISLLKKLSLNQQKMKLIESKNIPNLQALRANYALSFTGKTDFPFSLDKEITLDVPFYDSNVMIYILFYWVLIKMFWSNILTILQVRIY